MKLATYKDGSRDGQLVLVSRDLGTAHYATGIASTLQQVLDDWNFIAPQLQDLSVAVNQGRARHAFAFDPRRCMAPLPRAYRWEEGLAFANHAAQVRPDARPGTLHWVPGAGDDLLGPTDDVLLPDERWGADVGAGLAALTGDVPVGATPDQALEGVRLLMLVNALTLRQYPAAEGAVRLASAFSPVAVTPDELGDAWRQGRVHLTLQTRCNGRQLGQGDAGDMGLHFGQLLAQLCHTRRVRAGTIVGSGPVSSPAPATDGLRYGDNVRIEMKGRDGHSLFGAIDHTITPLD